MHILHFCVSILVCVRSKECSIRIYIMTKSCICFQVDSDVSGDTENSNDSDVAIIGDLDDRVNENMPLAKNNQTEVVTQRWRSARVLGMSLLPLDNPARCIFRTFYAFMCIGVNSNGSKIFVTLYFFNIKIVFTRKLRCNMQLIEEQLLLILASL